MSSAGVSRSRLPALLAFLVVIVLGEAVALFLEYQNNRFLQDYVSNNSLATASEAIGLVAIGLAAGYLVYRRSLAPRGVKGAGIFHRLGDIITRRHRLVIVAWVIILLLAILPALRVGQTVTSQTSTDTSNPTESTRAQDLISQQFPHQTSNSTALIVIVGSNVRDNATKQFVLKLENGFLAPGALAYVQNFTSIYSTERVILVSTILPLAPAIYGLVTQVNATAFLVYGVPAVYVANWTVAYGENATTADDVANATTWGYLNSPGLLQQMGPSAPLVKSYYLTFARFWKSYNSTSDIPTRETKSIDSAVLAFLAGPLPATESGFVTAVWQSLSMQTWNQPVAILQVAQGLMTSASPQAPALPFSLFQSIYQLGPSPPLGTVETLANQVINAGTLSTYPLLPRDLVGQFVNSKNDTMLVIVSFSKSPGTFSSAGSDPVLQDVLDMRTIVANLLASDPGPSRVYVTGSVATTADSSLESSKDIQRIDPVTIGAILVLVGVFFLAVVTPLVPLTAIGLAVVVAEGLVFVISRYVVPVQDTTLTFLTTVMLGVGTDYAIFLMARYREERVEGRNKNDAVHTSVKWVGESITTSGMTVILAFGAMSLGSFSLLKSMGIGIGTGVLIALLVSLTLIPAILTLAGDRVFWPSSGKRFEKYAARTREKRATRPSYFRRAASLSARKPKTVLLIALVLTIPAAYVGFTYATTYDFIAGLPNAESVQGLTALQQGFGAGRIGPTQVVAQFPTQILQGKGLTQDSAGALEELSQGIAKLSNVAQVTGPTRPEGVPLNVTDLSRLNPTDAAGVYASIGKDNRTTLLTVILSQEPFTATSLDTVRQIRSGISGLQALDPTLKSAQILVGGESASTADFAGQIVDQFTIMRIVVLAGIFVILLLVLGSYLLPVAAILSIGLSIIWSYATTIIFFRQVLNADILFIIPLILFLLLFGIGMDYNIFILTRIREEAQKGKSTREAVVDAVDRTGGIITALALILGGAIGSLMLSSNTLLQGFGFAIALAVVIDAMVVRTYLVPATMTLLGRWAWWGPRSLRRVAFDDKDKKAIAEPTRVGQA